MWTDLENTGGIVGSATLGGYDESRLAMHDKTFTMNQTEGIPRPLVRGIEVYSNSSADKPGGWKSQTQILLDYSKAFTAIIDTTTPYLWLPGAVCDNFAKALNLTYNETFGLYMLTNDQYRQYSTGSSLSFTFSFSSMDNRDNFGLPLDIPGVVNITVPIQAFVGLLSYPFMNQSIPYGAPAVPYFTLRRSPGNSTIIGNAFMQEAYLMTKYDSGVFSMHQARFPSDPIGGAKLAAIPRPPNSPYPPPPDPNSGNGLSTGEMVGIAVGAVAFFSVLVFAFLCYRRHKRQLRERAGDVLDDGKDSASTLTPDSPQSPVSRMFSRIVGRRRSRRTGATMTAGGVHPSEAPDHEIYELPAPIPPAELDAGGSDDHSILGETDLGTDSTQHFSAYEIARRKLDRQLQGPVPEYSPPADGIMPQDKPSIPELRPTLQTNMADQPSPISPTRSRGADSTTNTLLASEPSPVSPRGDWSSADLPSPVTASMPPRSYSSGTRSGGGHSTTSRSLSVNSNTPVSPVTDTMPPVPAAFQRTPIDPARVVCLGPLPGNVQLPGQSAGTGSRIVGSDGRSILPTGLFTAGSRVSEGSLGSNFTDEEDAVVEQTSRHTGPGSIKLNHGQRGTLTSRLNTDRHRLPAQPEEPEGEIESPKSAHSDGSSEGGRIDPGRDLIHVPQMADKRYSWEEDGS